MIAASPRSIHSSLRRLEDLTEEDVDGGAVRAEHRGQERGIGRVTVERNERASPSVETIYARFC